MTPRAAIIPRHTTTSAGVLTLIAVLAVAFAWWAPTQDRVSPGPWRGHVRPHSLAAGRTSDHLRVLFIGNSFTFFNGGVDNLVAQMAIAAGQPRPPIFESVAGSGYCLSHHWIVQEGRRRILEGNWDYVILQDCSWGPIEDPDGLVHYAGLFDQEIRSVGAKTILFLTWAQRDAPETQATLNEAYLSLGRRLGARVAPVGLAWAAALAADPSCPLYWRDGKHPSALGTYLTACVFYATLYGSSPEGLIRSFPGDAAPQRVDLTQAEAAFLQRIAAQTVERRRGATHDDPQVSDGPTPGPRPQ